MSASSCDATRIPSGPDLAFITKDRLPATEEEGFSQVVPDLVVEILSPSDRWAEVERKISEYLAASVKVIWIVDPSQDQVPVYRPGRTPEVLGKTDTRVPACRASAPHRRPGRTLTSH